MCGGEKDWSLAERMNTINIHSTSQEGRSAQCSNNIAPLVEV